jgi:hypothetical protein
MFVILQLCFAIWQLGWQILDTPLATLNMNDVAQDQLYFCDIRPTAHPDGRSPPPLSLFATSVAGMGSWNLKHPGDNPFLAGSRERGGLLRFSENLTAWQPSALHIQRKRVKNDGVSLCPIEMSCIGPSQ